MGDHSEFEADWGSTAGGGDNDGGVLHAKAAPLDGDLHAQAVGGDGAPLDGNLHAVAAAPLGDDGKVELGAAVVAAAHLGGDGEIELGAAVVGVAAEDSNDDDEDAVEVQVRRKHQVQQRRCGLCNSFKPEAGIREHRRNCCILMKSTVDDIVEMFPKKAHLIAIDNLILGPTLGVWGIVAGFTGNDLQRGWMNVLSIGDNHWSRVGCRPAHRGVLQSIGWCNRWSRPYVGTMAVRKEAHAMFMTLKDSSRLFSMLRACNRQLYDIVVHNITSLDSRLGTASTVNIYMGIDYVSASVPGEGQNTHPPPVQVTDLIGGLSCKDSCVTCRTQSCHECPLCCVHVDKDPGMTLLVGLQHNKTKAKEKMYFILGNRAFAWSETFVALFDGGSVPHGTWSPSIHQNKFFGCAMVMNAASFEAAVRVSTSDQSRGKKRPAADSL
jgi:hypothetical protein